MEIEVTHDEVGVHDVLTPHGEVDLASYVVLRDAMNELLARGRAHLVVDLGRTTFLDSTALGCLIGARSRTESADGSFTVLVDSPALLRLLAITRLDQVFEILPDRAAWEDSLQG
jgi:anti-sigma B factor antagonist